MNIILNTKLGQSDKVCHKKSRATTFNVSITKKKNVCWLVFVDIPARNYTLSFVVFI